SARGVESFLGPRVPDHARDCAHAVAGRPTCGRRLASALGGRPMNLLRHLAALTLAASGLTLADPHRPSQTMEGAELRRAANDVHPAAGCQVRGVWELVSVSQDGKDQPLGGYRGM